MKYFDYNATAPLCPAAKEAWLEAPWRNPSSPTRLAARAHNRLEASREFWANRLACKAEQIVFTSGATEANNAVFSHYKEILPEHKLVAISAIEHSCVLRSAKHYFGNRLRLIPVNKSGVVELSALLELLDTEDMGLVSIMAANNETGVMQPWQDAALFCRRMRVPFHCDAAQWLGKIPTSGLEQCDLLTGCAHKFGGPKGVGFLKIPANAEPLVAQYGGNQENGHRSGTEDLAAILAMQAAFENVQPFANNQPMQTFVKMITERIEGVAVAGSEERLPNTVMLVMPKHQNTVWLRKLDAKGFEVSTGSACSAGKGNTSHVLAAMGLTTAEIRRSLRISGGWETTDKDWEDLATAMIDVYNELENGGGLTEVIEL